MILPARETDAAAKPPRIVLLDTARGVALIAMASYHFSWDMEFMGYLGWFINPYVFMLTTAIVIFVLTRLREKLPAC
ncbi:heparan-alpha-glucosaminide N-acetyltransferase domain-containing protein, partial [Rhizobium ruizarguesonis]